MFRRPFSYEVLGASDIPLKKKTSLLRRPYPYVARKIKVPGGQKLAEIKLEHLKSKVEPMKGPHWLSCVIVWVTVVSLLRGDEVSFIHWAAFVSVTVLFTWPCLGAFMPFDNLRGCLP